MVLLIVCGLPDELPNRLMSFFDQIFSLKEIFK